MLFPLSNKNICVRERANDTDDRPTGSLSYQVFKYLRLTVAVSNILRVKTGIMTRLENFENGLYPPPPPKKKTRNTK